MKNLTRNKICKNFKYSPYTFTYFYNDKEITLFFSSKLHLIKFINNRQDNWSMIYNYIHKRFKFKIDCVFLSDINLYRKIEKRGFLLKINKTFYYNTSKLPEKI